MNKNLTIAIDGPSGAGKSSVAKALAKRLNIMHLDTGAMYRTVAVALAGKGIDPADEEAVLKALPELRLELRFSEGEQQNYADGVNLNSCLRTPEASMGASDVSRYPAVRRRLVALQQDCAKSRSFVLDGRDIGTVVLPRASAKFYLDARAEVRAQRRFLDLQKMQSPQTYAEVLADVQRRDAQDMNREDSPLRQAEDAVYIDSSELTESEVLDLIVEKLKERRLVGEAKNA